jgi:hypothetical protein
MMNQTRPRLATFNRPVQSRQAQSRIINTADSPADTPPRMIIQQARQIARSFFVTTITTSPTQARFGDVISAFYRLFYLIQ